MGSSAIEIKKYLKEVMVTSLSKKDVTEKQT